MKLLEQIPGFTLLLTGCLLLSSMPLHADPIWTNPGGNGRIEAAAFSADASRVAFRMVDGSVVLKSLGEPESIQVFSTAPHAATSLALSDDGTTLAWGDASGTLHLWSATNGLNKMRLSDAGLTGLALSADGSIVCAAGEGVRAWIKRTANFGYVGSPILNLQQVIALAADDSGDHFMALDQAGQLALFSSDSGSVQTEELAMDTPVGLAHVGHDSVHWVIWDTGGNISLVGSALEIIKTIDTGGLKITALFPDPDINRLLIADDRGILYKVSLQEYTLNKLSETRADDPIVGLGGTEKAGYFGISEFGKQVTSPDGETWQSAQPNLRGHVLRAHTSLRSGLATVLTDQEVRTFSLTDGSDKVSAFEDSEIVLDTAIFHTNGKDAPLRLVLNTDDLSLLLKGDSLPGSAMLEDDWSPVRLATDPWAPRLALMSTEGEVRIYDLQSEGLVEFGRLDPVPGSLWEDLEFTEDGASVSRIRAVTHAHVPAPDGPFELRMNPAGSLVFQRIETDPAFLAWPNLRPADGGGMESGYFGNIRAIRHPWFYQREFGWGYVSASQDMNYFRFPGEGWLAGNARLGAYLYSYGNDNWIYTLIPDFSSDWIYDFAQGQWRRFLSTEDPAL